MEFRIQNISQLSDEFESTKYPFQSYCSSHYHVQSNDHSMNKMITLAAKAKLPTLAGNFDIYTFQNETTNENAVIVKGDVSGS